MKANPEDTYRHIGYLFYAISTEQVTGSQKALDTLTTFIDHNWRTVTRGDRNLDRQLTSYIHTGIQNAFENDVDAYEAYEFFEEYYSLHHLLFGNMLRDRIVEFSRGLEEAFFRTKHQSVIVTQLEKLLRVKAGYADF